MGLDITKDYLKEKQYKSSDYLDARIAIHKFNTNPESFYSWIWKNLEINSPLSILEVGCGSGSFWKENYSKLPEGCKLKLTDFSEGMVNKARKNLENYGIEYETADIENLKYEDGTFDLVMAHHVVYHADDKEKALKELKRVAKGEGRVSITSNSQRHMRNVFDLGLSIDDKFPSDRIIDSFTEEVADEILPKFFKNVDKRLNEDLLKVTDLEIMINYVKSSVAPRNIMLCDDFYEKYASIVKKDIDDKGFFGIEKRSPLYICQ